MARASAPRTPPTSAPLRDRGRAHASTGRRTRRTAASAEPFVQPLQPAPPAPARAQPITRCSAATRVGHPGPAAPGPLAAAARARPRTRTVSARTTTTAAPSINTPRTRPSRRHRRLPRPERSLPPRTARTASATAAALPRRSGATRAASPRASCALHGCHGLPPDLLPAPRPVERVPVGLGASRNRAPTPACRGEGVASQPSAE